MRWMLLTGLLGTVAALGVALDSHSRLPSSPAPTSFPTQTAIHAAGRVEAQTRRVALRPQLLGRVVELAVQEGDWVDRDQVLLRLDASQYQAELRLAEAGLQTAEAQRLQLINGAHEDERKQAEALYQAKLAHLEQARRSWERFENLLERRTVSAQEADEKLSRLRVLKAEVEAAASEVRRLGSPPREDELAAAAAQIEAARARVELARVQLERTRLLSPMSGQVLQVTVELGELSGPEARLPALTLADTSRLRVLAYVEELNAARVRPGMAVTVTAEGLPGRRYAGRISRISPRMEPKELFTDDPTERFDTKTREVWIELDEHEGLVMGLRVDVRIELDEKRVEGGELGVLHPSPDGG